MKKPNELPKFLNSQSAIKQAKSDFRQLLKQYNIMQENGGTQMTSGENSIKQLKDEAKSRKGIY